VQAWNPYFTAMAGVAAVLTGLIFIAVSNNLRQILEEPTLPGRAGETLILLVESLLVSLIALIPGMSRTALGVAVLVMGIAGISLPAMIQLRTTSIKGAPAYVWVRLVGTQLATWPVIVAGVWILADGSSGVYWLAAGTAALTLMAVLNAWVLQIEIRR